MILYSTQMFQILIKNINSDLEQPIFQIHFFNSQHSLSLIYSLIKTNLLRDVTITNDYKIIQFKAFSIKSFKDHQSGKKISINNSAKIFDNLVTQLNYLIKKESKVFLGYNPEFIFVINDTTFVYLNTELIKDIQDDMITITSPFYKNDFFLSPELLKIKEIPHLVHFKTSYFSLGFILQYFLTGNDKIMEDKYMDPFSAFKNTKFFFLLSRMLLEEPKNRTILFI